MTVLLGLGIVSLVVVCGISWVFWQNSQRMQKQLEVEAENKKLLQREVDDLKNSLKHIQGDLLQAQKAVQTAKDKSTGVLRNKEEEITQLENFIAEQRKDISQLENRVEHYKEHADALLAQLKAFDAEKRDFKAQLLNDFKAKEKDVEKHNSEVDSRVRELQIKLRQQQKTEAELQDKVKSLEEKLKVADPEELKRVRLKNRQYNFLYNSLKGHKEILEERLLNWEKALRYLSEWIMQRENTSHEIPKDLGPLVATALELTKKGPLIEDEFSVPKQIAVKQETHIEKPEETSLQTALS